MSCDYKGNSMAHKPVLLISRRLPDLVHERATRDYDAHLNTEDRQYDSMELAANAARIEADAILVTPTDNVTRAVIEALPDCTRVLATFSVGYDHIDLAAAQERGLIVTNTPDVVTDATADIALLCLLGAARRAWEAETMLRRGDWTGWAPTQLLGVHPGGRASEFSAWDASD